MSHQDSLPADSHLPGLALAANPHQMISIFRAELRPLHGASFEIERCTLSRIRYRPGLRMHVVYELSLTDTITGDNRRLWVNGTLYPADRPMGLYKKLRARFKTPADGSWCPFEPVYYLSQPNMLLQVFPFDRRLPKLAKLLLDRRSNLVDRINAEVGTHRYRGEPFNIEPIRYRPGLGAALLATTVDANSENFSDANNHLYLKLYRNKRGMQTYPVQQILSRLTRSEDFSVAEPVAYLKDFDTLCEKAVQGESLYQCLVHHMNTDEACRRIGRALVGFQNIGAPISRAHDLKLEIDRAAQITRILCIACPQLRSKLSSLIETIKRGISSSELRLAHLDLKAEHLIFSGEKVFFIDLDACSLSNPLLDPSLFAVRLEAMKFQFPSIEGNAMSASKAFLEEYLSLTPAAYQRQMPYFYALACLKVALSLFQHQQLNWSEHSTEMIDRANLSLSKNIH